MAIDPVCGMTVDPRTALSAMRDGSTFYFCCPRCRDTFLSPPPPSSLTLLQDFRPEAVGKQSEAAGHCCGGDAPVAVAADWSGNTAPYICPMCPEAASDSPGACPICGMDLQPNPAAASSQRDDPQQERQLWTRFWISLGLTAPVLTLAMGPMVGLRLPPTMLSPITQFVLTTAVIFGCGWPFLQRAAVSLTTCRFNMFTLIGVGTLAAWLLSTAVMLWPGLMPAGMGHHGEPPIYFESAAVIITLVLLGQALESGARRKTGQAVRELLRLSPETAYLLSAEGEREVPLSQIVPGNVLRVKPGDRVPVDGEVVCGRAHVDESLLTGESRPVSRDVGDPVVGGTMNLETSFDMRVRHVGADTVLARLARLVAQAQMSRIPWQRTVDAVAAWFVPGVLLAAGLTFFGWLLLGTEDARLAQAFTSALSVLIVACPCALGLATPLSVMVGVGRGAREGILFREAAALEHLSRLKVLALDKTGTLTVGRPELVRIEPLSRFTPDELLALAAAVESRSEHSLAKALTRAAQDRKIPVADVSGFQSVTGGGVVGKVAGKEVLLGTPEFLESRGVKGLQEHNYSDPIPATRVWQAIDGSLAGVYSIRDALKPDAVEALRELRELGLRIVLISGDAHDVAEAMARGLGIDEVHARAAPETKQRLIQNISQRGEKVGMVGDGVNDAPALAAADVGIAIGTGANIAIETADVLLKSGDLRQLPQAIRLSRATLRNIRQNLFFALIYNGLGIPVAAGVLFPFTGLLMSPMLAAAAMCASSLCVVGNALRLRSVRL